MKRISVLYIFILWKEMHDIFDCVQSWFKTNTNTENLNEKKNIKMKTYVINSK